MNRGKLKGWHCREKATFFLDTDSTSTQGEPSASVFRADGFSRRRG